MAEIANTYDYSQEQAEVCRLHDRLRRCLMDQKYYAHRLSQYQRWDVATNLVAGAATLASLAARGTGGLVSGVFYALGCLAALILIGKPILKFSEQIERYTFLYCGFAEAFSRLDGLIADIRRSGTITDEHRTRAEEIIRQCDALALREDTAVNRRQLARFKAEVDEAIPAETLWLPSK